MNRRGFLASLLAGVVAPAFLPGTGRMWKRTEELWVLNPDYIALPDEALWGHGMPRIDWVMLPFDPSAGWVTPILYERPVAKVDRPTPPQYRQPT